MTLEELQRIIESRRSADPATSYTAKLLAGGVDRIGKKIGEESAELVIAAKNADRKEIANEAADLLYHTIVLLRSTGVSLDEVKSVLDSRHTSSV